MPQLTVVQGQPPDARDWLGVGEVARRLGVGEKRVRQLADRGDLVMRRGPYGREIAAASVEEFKEKREKK